jgi:hypothetical protein
VTASLERRYRRLLAWYPRGHRDIYQDEMLGVLLEGAGPDRTRPTLAEAASLIGGALRYRLRRARIELTDEQWRRAAAAIALFAPGLLLIFHVRALLGMVATRYSYMDSPPAVSPSYWAPVAAWAMVILAGLAGPRRVAAALAWAATLLEVAIAGLIYVRFPEAGPPDLWTVCLAVTGAAALTVCPGVRDGIRLLGWWRVAPAATVGALAAISPLGYRHVSTIFLGTPLTVIGLLVCCLALLRLPWPVRRRILAMVAPVVALLVLYNVVASITGAYPDLRTPAWWAVAIAVPVAAFWLAATAIAGWERLTRPQDGADPAADE